MTETSQIVDAANLAWRDFNTDGVPASGDHEPDKAEIRAVFPIIKDKLDEQDESLELLAGASVSGVTVKKATKAALDADLAHPADTLAVVFNDPTLENNRIYYKVGASGSGSWQPSPLMVDGTIAIVEDAVQPLVDDAEDAAAAAAASAIAAAASVQPFSTVSAVGPSRYGLFAGSATLIDRDMFGVTGEASMFDAWVNGGQVYAGIAGGYVQMTADLTTTYVKASVQGGLFSCVRADNARFSTPLAGSYPALDAATTTIEYSDMYGQSVAAGNASGAVVNGTASGVRHLMFGAGQRAYGNFLAHSQERTNPQQPVYDAIHDFVYAFEQLVDGAGETANFGYGYGLLNSAGVAAILASTTLLTTCSAVGSANQEMLWKNATENTDKDNPYPINTIGDPWANLESRFRRAVMFWRLQGFTFIAGPLRHNQGEGNINRTKANHLAGLVKFRDDWQALAQTWNALRTSGGFPGKAPFMVAQTCSGTMYSNGVGGYYIKSEVPWAQLQINLDDPTTALCVGPTYDQVYAPDGVHLQSLGQEMQGARQAVAYGEWLKGNQWHPLAVRKDAGFAPVRVGTTVTLRIWNHFNLALTFDTTTVTGLGASQGFQWFDNGDGNAVTVTNATIVNNTTVELTLSAVPTGTGGAIDVAMTGTGGASAGPTTGNRSTLRTNGSGVTTRGGRAVEHFICIDRVTVS